MIVVKEISYVLLLRILVIGFSFYSLPLLVLGADLTVLYEYRGTRSIDTTTLNKGIEFMHSYLLQVYELKKLEEVDTIRINLIDSHKEINALCPSPSTINGFFSRSSKECYVWMRYGYRNTVYHEVTHFFLDFYAGYHPPWVSEGLAEYFERMSVKDRQFLIMPPNLEHLRKMKVHTEDFNLRTYFVNAKMNLKDLHGFPDNDMRAIYRSLVFFLNDQHPQMLQDILLYKNHSFVKNSSYRLIDTLFKINIHQPGENFDNFEQQWKAWIQTSLEPHYLTTDPLNDKWFNRLLRKVTRVLG